MPPFALLMIGALVLLSATSASTRVGTATCGALITSDSLLPFEDGWTIDTRSSELNVAYSTASTTSWFDELVLSVSGRPASRVTVFDLERLHSSQESILGADACRFRWAPSAPAGVLIKSARISVLPIEDASLQSLFPTGNLSSTMCHVNASITYSARDSAMPMETVLMLDSTVLKALVASLTSANGAANAPLTMSNAVDISLGGVEWPIRFTIPFGCRMRLMLISNQVGDLNPWFKWVPVVTYSAVVMPSAMYSAFLTHSSQTSSSTSRAGMVFAMFIGFTGSSLGAAIELFQWRVVSGRLFPFPDAITFFVCFMCGYAVMFVPLLWNHACRELISTVIFKLLIWGLFIALTIAYWIAGFIILGSISLAFLFGTSSAMILLYTYFCARLPENVRPSNARWMWLPIFTPAAPIVLLYYDIIICCGGEPEQRHWDADRGTASSSPGTSAADTRNVNLILFDAVRLYSVISNMIFCLLATLPLIGLLGAATAFHWPLMVLFTSLVVLTVLHAGVSLQQYAKELRRWKIDGLDVRRMLWPAVDAVLAKHASGSNKRNDPRASPYVRSASVQEPQPLKAYSAVPTWPGAAMAQPPRPGTAPAAQYQYQQQQQQVYQEPAVFASTAGMMRSQFAAGGPAPGFAPGMLVPASQVRSGSLNHEMMDVYTAGGSHAPSPREYEPQQRSQSAADGTVRDTLAFRSSGGGGIRGSRQPSPIPFVYE
jgi:hypothetical protein